METKKILELVKKAEDKVNSTVLSNIRKTEINLILLEIQKEAINYSQCCMGEAEQLNIEDYNKPLTRKNGTDISKSIGDELNI
jgi:hypothetical protein